VEQQQPSNRPGFPAGYVGGVLNPDGSVTGGHPAEADMERDRQRAGMYTYNAGQFRLMSNIEKYRVENRPDYVPLTQMGNSETQRQFRETANTLSSDQQFALMGRILEGQRDAAYKTEGLADDRYFDSALEQWGQNASELSAAQHHLIKNSDIVGGNELEARGDLAIEFLKGSPGKSSEWFSPLSGQMSPYLPGGRGVQQYSWDKALSTARGLPQPGAVSFMAAVERVGSARGSLFNPSFDTSANRNAGNPLNGGGGGRGGPGVAWLPGGISPTGEFGRVESGNAKFVGGEKPFKLQSPVGGLLGLHFFGDKKDEVIRGAAGATIDVITGFVGWTPAADSMRTVDPSLTIFRMKSSGLQTNITNDMSLFESGKKGYATNATHLESESESYKKDVAIFGSKVDMYNKNPSEVGFNELNQEKSALESRYTHISGEASLLDAEYATLEGQAKGLNKLGDLYKDAEGKGILIRQQGQLVENPDLIYDYGVFSKWNVGAGKTVMGAIGTNRTQLDYLQTIAEAKPGLSGVVERLGVGGMQTVLTRPGNLVPYAAAGAALFLGGELIGGATAGSATLQGMSRAHPLASRLTGGAIRYGVPTIFAGATYYSASEGLTATPERTQINIGRTLPEFGAMFAGGGAAYAISRSNLPIGFRTEGGGKKPFGQNLGDHTVLPGRTPIEAKWSNPAMSTTRKPTVLLNDVAPTKVSFMGSEPMAQGIPRRMGSDFTKVDFNSPVSPRTLNAEAMRLVDRPVAAQPPEAWRDIRTSGVPMAPAKPMFGTADTPITIKPANFYRDMEIHFGETGGSRPTEMRGSSGQITMMKPGATISEMVVGGSPLESMGLPRVESTTLLELEGARGTGMNKQPTLAQSHLNWMNRKSADAGGMRSLPQRVKTPYDFIKAEAKPVSPATMDNSVPYKSEMWKQYYELPGTPDMSYTKGDSLKHLRDMLGARKSIATVDTRGTAIKGRGIGVYPIESRVAGSKLTHPPDQVQLRGMDARLRNDEIVSPKKAQRTRGDQNIWEIKTPKTDSILLMGKVTEPVKPQKTRQFVPILTPMITRIGDPDKVPRPEKPRTFIEDPVPPRTPKLPPVPGMWFPDAGGSSGDRPRMRMGVEGWTNTNPVADIPYLSKGMTADPFSGGGNSGGMSGFGAKCRHTNAKLKKKCGRFKRNG
jgi:hypothetical protein